MRRFTQIEYMLKWKYCKQCKMEGKPHKELYKVGVGSCPFYLFPTGLLKKRLQRKFSLRYSYVNLCNCLVNQRSRKYLETKRKS